MGWERWVGNVLAWKLKHIAVLHHVAPEDLVVLVSVAFFDLFNFVFSLIVKRVTKNLSQKKLN